MMRVKPCSGSAPWQSPSARCYRSARIAERHEAHLPGAASALRPLREQRALLVVDEPGGPGHGEPHALSRSVGFLSVTALPRWPRPGRDEMSTFHAFLAGASTMGFLAAPPSSRGSGRRPAIASFVPLRGRVRVPRAQSRSSCLYPVERESQPYVYLVRLFSFVLIACGDRQESPRVSRHAEATGASASGPTRSPLL